MSDDRIRRATLHPADDWFGDGAATPPGEISRLLLSENSTQATTLPASAHYRFPRGAGDLIVDLETSCGEEMQDQRDFRLPRTVRGAC